MGFVPGKSYILKSKSRGGDPGGLMDNHIPVAFKVVSMDLEGNVICVFSYADKEQKGIFHPNHHYLIAHYLFHFFVEFTPTDTKFSYYKTYRATSTAPAEVLANMGLRGNTSFRNYIRHGASRRDALEFRVWNASNGVITKISKKPSDHPLDCYMPGWMSCFFEEVGKTSSEHNDPALVDTDTEVDMETPVDSAVRLAEKAKRLNKIGVMDSSALDRILEAADSKSKPTEKTFVVSEADKNLLDSIHYLLATREIFSGRRTRLGMMQETYSRDDVKTPASIIEYANIRKEEIEEYRKKTINEMRRTAEQLKMLDSI